MILFAAALLLPWCAGAAAPEKGAVPVIFETDMGNDIDDALALDLLYKGMDAGHIRLIGVSLNKRSSTSFEFIDLMNTWYGYPDIPIAYTPRAVDNKDRDYTTPVCELKASDGKPLFKRSRKPGSWEDPVAMYRRLLAAEPDNSVVVVSVVAHAQHPRPHYGRRAGLHLLHARQGGTAPLHHRFRPAGGHDSRLFPACAARTAAALHAIV